MEQATFRVRRIVVICLLVMSFSVVAKAVSGSKIASTADKYIGDTKWSYSSSHGPFIFNGVNKNKCNIFVADVIEEAGGSVPQRHWWRNSPIGAGEWGNSASSYLSNDPCWRHVTSSQIGDVIGDGVHVGIVTGARLTTSAAEYSVLKNDFGFRSDQEPMVFWRYQYNSDTC